MLAMDTRRRAAPLRPAVDNVRHTSPRVDIKEASLVLRSRAPVNNPAFRGTACQPPVSLASTGSELSTAVTSPFAIFDKSSADCRSETSRSSTPVTDMSSMCPSTGSSFATSVQPDGECGYPKDEENDSCASRSDKDSGSGHGEMKFDDEDIMATAKEVLNTRSLRESQLRNSMAALSAQSRISDSDESDYAGPAEEDDEHPGTYEDDDDWSGTDSLDAAVIAAVDGDLSLAAFLIPLLHKDVRNAVRNKVESWQNTSTIRSPSSATGSTVTRGGASGATSGATSGSSIVASGSSGAQNQVPDQSRKRRRRPSDSEDDREEGEDEHGGNGGNGSSRPEMIDEPLAPLLACPFHKLNPSRYGIQHNVTSGSRKDGYRACAGPGFKSIQRLKEHLKRKHTPVQCERCYQVFSGSDKARCINELTEHLRLEVPCQKGESVLKEGISEAQWAALDKQNRKKNQEKHKLEKWFEIWRVLFPEVPEPETPWYNEVTQNRFPSPSRENEAFADLFLHILNHKVQQGDISFPGCNTDDVQQRLRNLVQQTFRTYVNLHGPMSRTTETTSSLTGTNNVRSSLLGGSSTQQSRPTNSMSLPATTTSHTTGISQMHAQTTGQYAMSMPAVTTVGVPGLSYAVPMPQRPNNYSQYHHTPMTVTSLPGQVAGTAGTAMQASFAGNGQEEMPMYYSTPMMHWQSAGMQYGTGPMATGQYQGDFYSQSNGFVPGPGADYNNCR